MSILSVHGVHSQLEAALPFLLLLPLLGVRVFVARGFVRFCVLLLAHLHFAMLYAVYCELCTVCCMLYPAYRTVFGVQCTVYGAVYVLCLQLVRGCSLCRIVYM